MKLFLKILAGLLAGLILFVIALNIYFSDERLKELIEPRISESLQTPVEIDRLSLTFLRTFPDIGIEMEGFRIPYGEGQPALSVERLTGGVRLFPLIQSEIDVSQLIADNPSLFYHVYSDSSTNFDWFFNRESVSDDTTGGMSFSIPEFLINNGDIRYSNDISGGFYELRELSADVSLEYGDILESTIDATLQSLVISSGGVDSSESSQMETVRDRNTTENSVSAESQGSPLVIGVPIELHQIASYNPDSGLFDLREGWLRVMDLQLDLTGQVDNSGLSPNVNLAFSSATDELTQIIDLLPESYRDRLSDTEASGSLSIEGTVTGEFSNEHTPELNLDMAIADGVLRNSAIRAPLENIQMMLSANNERIELQRLSLLLSGKSLQASGRLDAPFSNAPTYSLSLAGSGLLNDLTEWIPLDPWIQSVDGSATLDLTATGLLGDLYSTRLNGRVELAEVSARGDSLEFPVTNLNSVLNISPDELSLNNFSMTYGSSDIRINGSLSRYLTFLGQPDNQNRLPELTGNIQSSYLNMDELIDWEDDSNAQYNIDLPDMFSRLTARVDTLAIFGVPITNLSGSSESTPSTVRLTEAEATLFNGRASGTLDWDLSDPSSTQLLFNGRLDSLQIESLFSEFPVLGHGSRLPDHIRGLIHARVSYETTLDSYLDPVIPTIRAEGQFGLTNATFSDHPIQLRLAEWLRSQEIESLQLDNWQTPFTLAGSELTFSNLQISSNNIGLDLMGAQNIESGTINYTATLMLPQSFRSRMASILSDRAVTLLTREDGQIFIPIELSGTLTSPRLSPRQQLIDDLVRQAATDAARNTINRLFQRDSTATRRPILQNPFN